MKTFMNNIRVFPEMAYTKFMITCMLHFRESYHESYPWFQQGRAKHTPKHTPETYLRNIPRIIPPDATRFAGHGVFGKGAHFEADSSEINMLIFMVTNFRNPHSWIIWGCTLPSCENPEKKGNSSKKSFEKKPDELDQKQSEDLTWNGRVRKWIYIKCLF